MSCKHAEPHNPYAEPRWLCDTCLNSERRKHRLYQVLTWVLVAVTALVFWGCVHALGEALTRAL